MQAIVHQAYGAFDQLRLETLDRPAIGADEVLVRVLAAGLHIGDCFGVRGAPTPIRLMTGLLKPRYGVPGLDLAGRVEAVGSRVTRFAVGDEVFGAGTGSCAEFARASERTLAHKPASLSFEQAAAMPTSALAALRALRDVAQVQPGQKVLINGASGGVGTFAVQLARLYGAEVTGVCSTANVALVRSLGAQQVIDYTREDFTAGTPRYDLILDNVENQSLAACRRVLAPDGMLILNSGSGASGFAMVVRLFAPLVLNPFVRQTLRRFLSMPNPADLDALKTLVEAGHLAPVIGSVHPLQETAAALRQIEAGHARGKVVITLAR